MTFINVILFSNKMVAVEQLLFVRQQTNTIRDHFKKIFEHEENADLVKQSTAMSNMFHNWFALSQLCGCTNSRKKIFMLRRTAAPLGILNLMNHI